MTAPRRPGSARKPAPRRPGPAIALAGALAAGVLLARPPGAAAAELVMFEEPYCAWCQAWDREVGAIYPKTEEGRRVPLRRVRIGGPRPADLRAIKGIVFTPTFVLVDRGAEIGRIVGYLGEDHFWGLFGVLLRKPGLEPGS